MLTNTHQPIKVAIIGTGRVGASCAYALQLHGLASDIVLINANRQRAEGEAMDINHGSQFTKPVRVWAGDYKDRRDADIVVLAAGTSQKPGDTRLDLLKNNVHTWRTLTRLEIWRIPLLLPPTRWMC
jgi:L-lactate dehydrogenase